LLIDLDLVHNLPVIDSAGIRYYSVSPGQQATVWKEDSNGNQFTEKKHRPE
jgi:hypothetical protein